ncbi:ACT domain-containing protein [Marine Group I thaumarchaeote]|uniref:ACT domain-containing protein n=1 Tax=Marine Group I thaumarchaeote TaxID=2511932 RepID=A0A7K4N0N6_9ARCH|nr:ACT domain-containing protein [Marine Group I thaumarchaeote]
MRTVGLSIPDVVREIITRNRSIHDCMAMDVINYTALAVKIQPQVEKQIGNAVQLNTIVVAIKRYADAFEKNENVVDEPVLKDARLSMTDRIMGMRWTMKDLLDRDMAKMFAEAEKAFSNSEFFRLGDSFTVLADDSDVTRRIFQNFPKENLYSSGLAKIRIQVPEQNRADILSFVTGILHRNSIELVDALFSQNGIVLFLKEDQAPLAYEKLRSEIPRQ